MRAVWLSDIHMDFLNGEEEARFLEQVDSAKPDVVMISGDISVARTIREHLVMLHDALNAPIYFVLGNHDFYRGSIEDVRREVAALSQEYSRLVYLTGAGVQQLTPAACVVGHDSWADGRLGDYANSEVALNDYVLIKEVTGLDQATLLTKLNTLGDEAAACLTDTLPEALRAYSNVFVVTHVPPFREACWYQGRVSDDDYLPHFGCQAVGEVLRRRAAEYPNSRITVLCGHTHGAGEAQILDNLKVLTAGAEYGHPCIQRVFEVA